MYNIIATNPIRVHWTGCGYYYVDSKGQQCCKEYKRLGNLYRFEGLVICTGLRVLYSN